MQFFGETHFKLLEMRRYGYIFSTIAIVIGLVSLLFHGGIRYSIDFTGGTSLHLSFQEDITSGQLRDSITNLGLGSVEIKKIGLEDENEYIIRVEQSEEGAEMAETLEQKLSQDFSQNPYEILQVTEIGPKIGGELRKAAILSIFIALLGILIYVSWRFEFKFAIGAVAALFHDVLITLGIFSLLNLEISLAVVAAFLTIVGYSLNDTIVVYDRIRENLKILRRDSYDKVINKSLNQTLSRTIITSLTTLVVVVILFIFGGEVIHNFSFALIIGVLIGTYSSIFVASPLVFEWHKKFESVKPTRARTAN
ncbi:protein translocase subunit SecF [candidate division KSB1 bacterium]|nr:protein translocase subunit SecF [candidate division KSB1 bacterium]